MKLAILLTSFAIAGCSSLPSVPISSKPANGNLTEKALISSLASAFEVEKPIECDKKKGCGPASKPSVKYKNLSPAQITYFLDAGMSLSYLYCDQFFRTINGASRKRQFSRGAVNDAGGAIAGVLGLVKAGSGVTGGTAAGFSFIDSTFRNYDESFLVDTNIAKMQRLVTASQDDIKRQLKANPPTTVFDAETAIVRHSRECSFLGMQDLIDTSLGNTIKTIEEQGSVSRKAGNSPAPKS